VPPKKLKHSLSHLTFPFKVKYLKKYSNRKKNEEARFFAASFVITKKKDLEFQSNRTSFNIELNKDGHYP